MDHKFQSLKEAFTDPDFIEDLVTSFIKVMILQFIVNGLLSL
ncbi:hypothetical protein [Weissella viridescens]|nr:hypothetical protein [Weissella viridescens]